MNAYIKSSIYFLLGLSSTIVFAQNKPTDSYQPIAPSSSPSYSFPDYNSVIMTSPIFNYERTYIPRVGLNNITTADYAKTYQSTSYYNGFGEAMETIDRKGSGVFGEIVTPIDCRKSLTKHSFVPYYIPALYGINTSFQQNPFNSQIGYHNTTGVNSIENGFSFSESKTTVNSGVVTSNTYGTGLSLIGSQRGTKAYTKYNTTSSNGNITKWGLSSTGLPQVDGFYNDGEITVSYSEGQHNTEQHTYTDKTGKLLCKSVKNGSNWLETWYVYDDFGRLAWVLPPPTISYTSGVMNTPTTAMLSDLAYSYKYNRYGQVIEKKVPEKASADYLVYDNKHRLVLAQTPEQRKSYQWYFNIYDDLDRVVMTGIFTDPEHLSRAEMQTRTTNSTWPSGITFQPLFTYLRDGFIGTYPSAITNCELYTFSYYDSYSSLPSNFSGRTPYVYPTSEFLSGTENIYPDINEKMVKGLLVGTKVKVLDPSNTNSWIYSINYYDKFAKLIQVQTLNPWNTSNQWDIVTTQYNFSGKPVLNINQHYSWPGSNKANTKIATKYIYNINNGDLANVQQKVDNGDWRELASYSYNQLGQVSKKLIGSAEEQNYTYNIRGQLTGVNKDHVYNNMVSYPRTFGEIVCYDYGFDKKRYDGSIAGYVWRGSGMLDCPRSYGYEYDDMNRMTAADFNQRLHPNGPTVPPGTTVWKHTDVDYSTSDIVYDNNGNMMAMKQQGMAIVGGVAQPVQVDDLSYNYIPGTNKLADVSDPAPYHTNDFLDGNTSGSDYGYDDNGNLKLDNNKGITDITYNNFNQPLTVTKGTTGNINNIYDGSGNLLQKVVVDGSTTTTYRYWGNFVYKNNKLDRFYHQEGQSRWVADSAFFKDDYFIRDHLGNVRTIVTADISYGVTQYHAGFEMAYAVSEESIFNNISGVRDMKPVGNPTDLMSGKLNGANLNEKIGASILIHAMAGDHISLNGYGYYESEDTSAYNTYSTPEDMMNALVNTLTNGNNGLINENQSIPGLAPGTISGILNPVNYNTYDALKNAVTDPNYPRSYLNYLVFDENMNLLPDESEVIQLKGTPGSWINFNGIVSKPVKDNGYVLTYFSNESNIDVYVDNEHIVNIKGRLLQEQHYYPHGVLIEAPVLANPALKTDHSYQTKANQHELGLELHDFHARQYDAQIGRFCSSDPLNQFASGYVGMGNNPANLIDPTGMASGSSRNEAARIFSDNSDYFRASRSWEASELRRMEVFEEDYIPAIMRGGYASNALNVAISQIKLNEFYRGSPMKDGMIGEWKQKVINRATTQAEKYAIWLAHGFYNNVMDYTSEVIKKGVFVASNISTNIDEKYQDLMNVSSIITTSIAFATESKTGQMLAVGGSHVWDVATLSGKKEIVKELQMWSSNTKFGRYVGASGKVLGGLGAAFSVANMALNEDERTLGNATNLAIGLISTFVPGGWAIGAAYLLADFATESITGEDIATHIDNFVND